MNPLSSHLARSSSLFVVFFSNNLYFALLICIEQFVTNIELYTLYIYIYTTNGRQYCFGLLGLISAVLMLGWRYNPPFSKNISTNIRHRFLALGDNHFPRDHKLRKIFNRNTIKISYSCMANTKQTIDNHNKRILKSSGHTKMHSRLYNVFLGSTSQWQSLFRRRIQWLV